MTDIQTFDTSANLLEALLWEHNKAVNLTALLQAKQNWYDENVTQFVNDWVRDVFDLRTANDFGLQVWARILDFPLQIYVPPSPNKWGFGSHHKNFNRGNFSSKNGSVANLTPEEQRVALQLRYLKMTQKPTTPNINKILYWVFKDYGRAWVLDGLNMNMTYVFDFETGSKLDLVLQQYDLLPRPAAVSVSYVKTGYPAFGFGANKRNFNRGVFRK